MFDHNYLRFDQNKYKVRYVCSLYHVEMLTRKKIDVDIRAQLNLMMSISYMALPRKLAERIIQAMKG